jgi:hypothetical protein
MIPLVEFPELVEHYAPYFTGIFSEAAFIEGSVAKNIRSR